MDELIRLLGVGNGGWGGALLSGAVVTMEIAFTSYLVGALFGLLGAAAKLSRFMALRWLSGLYTTIVRGVPEILIILLIYYGGTSAIRDAFEAIGYEGEVEIDGFTAAVVALGTVAGAYMTEIFRGGIQAVPNGQWEAARSLGLPWPIVYGRIVLPQMFRVTLPSLSNLWLSMLKDSALISVVGLHELLASGQMAAASTRQPFTFYFAVSVLFLVLTVISMVFISWGERYNQRGYGR